MDTATMKQRLHHYLEVVDEKHLEAIYTLLERDLNLLSQYDDGTLNMLYQRREYHLEGKSQSYSVEETLNLVREQTSKKDDL